MINIIKGDKPTPNPSWLASVRTGKARAEIRQYMRSLSEEGKIELGAKLLERSSKTHHLPYSKVTDEGAASANPTVLQIKTPYWTRSARAKKTLSFSCISSRLPTHLRAMKKSPSLRKFRNPF